jgi:hypothetical protein
MDECSPRRRIQKVSPTLEIKTVSDLSELANAVPRTPVTVALSDITIHDDELRLPGRDPLELDDIAADKLSKFLSLPSNYLRKVDPELRAANFNFWLQNSGPGLASLYSMNSTLTGISDPNRKSFPLGRYLDLVVNHFDETDEIAEFHTESEYLHIDVVTEAQIEVPGDGSERRPAVGDITKAGVRLIAYPDLDKPAVLSSYLHRLWCTNGASIAEEAGRISLRGKNLDEIYAEMEAGVATLKIALGSRLDEYRATADIHIEGETALFVYNMANERGLSRNVTNRLLDLSSGLGDNPSVYDITQVFTEVANDSVNYNSRLALQNIGGYLSGDTDHALNRCSQCAHPFVDYNQV